MSMRNRGMLEVEKKKDTGAGKARADTKSASSAVRNSRENFR